MTESALPVIELPEDIDETMSILQLVTGITEGQPFWAYLAMFPSRYQEYRAKVEGGFALNLEEFGKVIETGWGKEPPADVQERLTKEFGFESDFENKLNTMLTKMLEDEGVTE